MNTRSLNKLTARDLREPTERLSLVVPITMRDTMLELAEAEQRSLSAMTVVLLREALEARRT